jgi:hypothetical protein
MGMPSPRPLNSFREMKRRDEDERRKILFGKIKDVMFVLLEYVRLSSLVRKTHKQSGSRALKRMTFALLPMAHPYSAVLLPFAAT